jgi:hypothetical protein
MNTLTAAEKQLNDFMNSDEKCVLITGTHQFEKHVLALRTVAKQADRSNILFRVNALDNLGSILKSHNRKYKSGVAYKVGSNNLYFDSLRSNTWRNTPQNIEYAILYPLDSVTKSNNQQEVIDDLFSFTGIKKIFLVSWTDRHDFSWVNEYIDRHVIYDAEEENPAYHQRVLDLINK